MYSILIIIVTVGGCIELHKLDPAKTLDSCNKRAVEYKKFIGDSEVITGIKHKCEKVY